MRVNAYSQISIFEMCSSYTTCHFPSALNAVGAMGMTALNPGSSGFGVCSALGRRLFRRSAGFHATRKIERLRRTARLRPTARNVAAIFLELAFVQAAHARNFETQGIAVKRDVTQRQHGVLIHAVHRAAQLAAAGLRDRHHQMQLAAQHSGPYAINAIRGVRGLAQSIRPPKTKIQVELQRAEQFSSRFSCASFDSEDITVVLSCYTCAEASSPRLR